jgi:tetrahydromethanopterin S-methyltransferase subunit A
MTLPKHEPKALEKARALIEKAAASRKCLACGCFRQMLTILEQAAASKSLLNGLSDVRQKAKSLLVEQEYDCFGCKVCYPPLVFNSLSLALGEDFAELEVCPAEPVAERRGWPPLPGNYRVLRYQAPVAVCTLMDEGLTAALGEIDEPGLSMVGTLQTENLGIERLIQNVLANPHLRFLILCGADSEQAVGHRPGQSLLALWRQGVNEQGRIIEAQGRRPLLKNISPEMIAHFRQTVEVLDLIGRVDPGGVIAAIRACTARNPGLATPFCAQKVVEPIKGHLPAKMIGDPAGYFVVYVDHHRSILSLEHYDNDGVLDVVIEADQADSLYIPAIERGLISRLDHAAYLGRELARAEEALRTGAPYIQDAAPEEGVLLSQSTTPCGTSCRESQA